MEIKVTFVPPTSIEQADEMIRKELLSLLEHDNAKYPPEEKENNGKKKGANRPANGSIPSIEYFEEDEMKEADSMIKEEVEFLHVAMRHENESLDDFLEAHNTCLNDLIYFPTRNDYGLSSVAGNMEKLAALPTEFDNVKKTLDNDKSKQKTRRSSIFSLRVMRDGLQLFGIRLSQPISRWILHEQN